ncbi:CotH kinase family protein [Acholeplasma granularum]|uniref:CotH kinase family protein n=1 Tax=Acholeplasma granularum TaxID=264635 RepID=UPI00046FA070|nr:CotH kinase family protein [Acholeplasma granularum]
MKKIFSFILSLIVLFLIGCNPNSNILIPDENLDNIDYTHGLEHNTYLDSLYNDFFNPNSTVEIKIDIEPSELALIQSDYEYYSSIHSKSPIYRKSDVTFKVNGVSYEFLEVGIRMKGNTSRTSFYNDSDGMFDMIHFKLSFKETFDDEDEYINPKVWENNTLRTERKNRRFAQMEKLDLKWNRTKDETYSREYWTYRMFESHGVLSPNITPVNLKINYNQTEENFGVVYALETIDELFLEKRLNEKHLGGDLYKVGWNNLFGGELTTRTLEAIGIEDEKISYFPVYDLKTNKKTSTNELLIHMIETLNASNDFEDIIHINYYLAFEAISYLVGNPDDLRNHYNNYYIYFLKDSSKAIFIPYDYDRTFGINWDWDPTSNAMTSYSPYSTNTTMGGINDQVNPLVLKTIARNSSNIDYIETYKEMIIDAVNSKFYKPNEFENIFNIHKNKYNNLTDYSLNKLSDKSIDFNYNETFNMPFNTYREKKLETLRNLINSY